MSSESKIGLRASGRIAMADDGPLTEQQQAVNDEIVAGKRGQLVGPLRVVLHSPELADRWQVLGEYLRYDSSLPKQLSELAIIMTGRYWNSQVEFMIHGPIAVDVGIDKGIVEAIRTATAPAIAGTQLRAVYAATRELLLHAQVSDGVYEQLLQTIGAESAIELTALVGYYTMVAMMLNAHEVPEPEDATEFRLDMPQREDLATPTRLPPLNN